MNYKNSICIALLLIANTYIYSSSTNNQSDTNILTHIDQLLTQKHPTLEKYPALQDVSDNRILHYMLPLPGNQYAHTARIAHRFVIAQRNVLTDNNINEINSLVATLTQSQAEAFNSIVSAFQEQ